MLAKCLCRFLSLSSRRCHKCAELEDFFVQSKQRGHRRQRTRTMNGSGVGTSQGRADPQSLCRKLWQMQRRCSAEPLAITSHGFQSSEQSRRQNTTGRDTPSPTPARFHPALIILCIHVYECLQLLQRRTHRLGVFLGSTGGWSGPFQFGGRLIPTESRQSGCTRL